MPPRTSKKASVVAALALIALGGGALLIVLQSKDAPAPQEPAPRAEPEQIWPAREVIGESVEGRTIEAYIFGDGPRHVLFVGGMHGGYEWNSVVLAYRAIDYFTATPEVIPDDLTVSVIPSINPDGVYEVVGVEGRFSATDVPQGASAAPGRFNSRGVDLNRNFDCKWQPESTWRGKTVSAGTGPFSEPETRVLRDFILARDPEAVIFWHSQSNAVYASECEEGILPETLAIMRAYAEAAAYPAVESFDHYEITGDAEGWLASIGIPALTVELSSHEAVEWERNREGMHALLEYYGEERGLAR